MLSVGSCSEEPDGFEGLVASELTLSDEVSSPSPGLEALAEELAFEEDADDEVLLATDEVDELLPEEAVTEEVWSEADEPEAVLLEEEYLLAYQSFFSTPFISI